jgi:hypothetical protein
MRRRTLKMNATTAKMYIQTCNSPVRYSAEMLLCAPSLHILLLVAAMPLLYKVHGIQIAMSCGALSMTPSAS